MKCGTTTLTRWLDAQPEVFFPAVDEPSFFNIEPNWERGLDWYASLFRGATEGQLIGDDSPLLAHPDMAPKAAERIHQIIPHARLILLVRHPVARIQSQYRHLRMTQDEHRSLDDAVRERSFYTRLSMYHSCLEAYAERFEREQILVVRLEDLVGSGQAGWTAVLEHLGLPSRQAPMEAHNVSEDQGLYRVPMRFLRDAEVRRRLLVVPAPFRRFANRALQRRGPRFQQMLDESRVPIADDVMAPVWDDIAKLEAWLGRTTPLWDRDADVNPRTV